MPAPARGASSAVPSLGLRRQLDVTKCRTCLGAPERVASLKVLWGLGLGLWRCSRWSCHATDRKSASHAEPTPHGTERLTLARTLARTLTLALTLALALALTLTLALILTLLAPAGRLARRFPTAIPHRLRARVIFMRTAWRVSINFGGSVSVCRH
jgi:hypothetical protein